MPQIIAKTAPTNGLITFSVEGHPELIVRAKSWLDAERALRAQFESATAPAAPVPAESPTKGDLDGGLAGTPERPEA